MQGNTPRDGHGVSDVLFEQTEFQKRLLSSAQDSSEKENFNDYMTLRCAFRVRPRLSPRSLSRAFDRLVARHEALRIQFVETGRGLRGRILAQHPNGLKVLDLTGLSTQAQDATLLEYAAKPVLATDDALFEMFLFQCGGDQGDVVFTRANHAVCDGHSIRVIMEDILKGILNVPGLRRAPSYREYLDYYSSELDRNAQQKQAFWNAHVLPLPRDPNIGRKAKGLPPLSDALLSTNIRTAPLLRDDEVASVETRARSLGVSSFVLFHAAFSEMLCDVSETDAVLVWSVMRDGGAKMHDLVGPNVFPFVVRYDAREGDINSGAKWLKTMIAQIADHIPTPALSLGSAIHETCQQSGTTFKRFRVHAPYPFDAKVSGALSPFLLEGAGARVSVGFLSLELLDLPERVQSSYELDCIVVPTNGGQNVSFLANIDAFSEAELADLGQRMRRHLGFAS